MICCLWFGASIYTVSDWFKLTGEQTKWLECNRCHFEGQLGAYLQTCGEISDCADTSSYKHVLKKHRICDGYLTALLNLIITYAVKTALVIFILNFMCTVYITAKCNNSYMGIQNCHTCSWMHDCWYSPIKAREYSYLQ